MYRDDKIRGRQAEKSWSNERLAKEANVNPNTITVVRRGGNVKTDTLKKVADALELSMAEIFEPRPAAEQQAAA